MNIYIEDIIGNIMIEVNKLNSSTKISSKLINLYTEEVICNLYQNKVEHHLVLNEKLTKEFESKYSDSFTPYKSNSESGYILNKDKTINDLEETFRSKIDSDLINAFTNPEVIRNGIVKYFDPKFPDLYQECHKYPEIQLHTRYENPTVKQKPKVYAKDGFIEKFCL